MQHGPFLELERDLRDLWSEGPWYAPSWQICARFFEKMREQGSLWVGKEALPMEKVSCFSWPGAGGSHMEGNRETFIVLHPEVSKHFPEGLELATMARSKFHWWDLTACFSTDRYQISPSRGSRSLGPYSRGPETPECVNSSSARYFNSGKCWKWGQYVS